MDKDVVYTHTHTHTHTEECFQPGKKDKVLPLVAIWMDLENIIHTENRWKDEYLHFIMCGI